MSAPKPSLPLIAGAVLAPLVTWLPMLAVWGWRPSLVPIYPSTVAGLVAWQEHVLWAALLGFLAVVASREDRWLGVGVGYLAVTVLVRGAQIDLQSCILIAIVSVGLIELRKTGTRARKLAQRALVGVGLFQAGYLMLQVAGYDPLWGVTAQNLGQTMTPYGPIRSVSIIGTLGNAQFAGSLLALTLPLASWWLAPALLLPLVATKSTTALAAAVVGLSIRWRHRMAWWATLGFGALAVTGLLVYKSPYSLLLRLGVWEAALEDFLAADPTVWFAGYGLGAWMQRVPQIQMGEPFLRQELFAQAHSDLVQAVYELGLIGAGIAVLWLRSHRGMMLTPIWGGAVAALAVLSLTTFPLHHVALALIGVVVLGFAQSPILIPREGA